MRLPVALAMAALAAGCACAADATDGVDFFEKKIRPVLIERCYNCHSAQAKTVMGNLRLDSKQGTARGGDSGKPAVWPGDLEKSRLMLAIKRTGSLKMPPDGPLPPEQIADFEAWIKMGAPDPRPKEMPLPAPYDFEKARKFWSFQPVKDPTPPNLKETADIAWNKTPIDRFVKAKLAEKKLTPAGFASKRVLIRRATFDLTGLPPTPEDVAAFVADVSPNAFDKVIDRLLASQQYGERWGRHWLDVVRYADTCGDNSDFPVPDAYRYRNWVIHAFNDDMPYDEFLREQIAGDLLPVRNDSASKPMTEDRNAKIVATGYLAIARRFGSGAADLNLTIDDTIDNVGKAMLGLSVACARCHDHKFDPIPSRDYYALYGIFESSKYPFPGTELYPHAKDFVALSATGTPARAAQRLKTYQDETSQLEHRIEAFNNGREGKELSKEDKDKEIQRMKDRMATLERNFPAVAKAYAMSEGTPRDANIQRKGDPTKKGEEVPRGFLEVLGGQIVPPDEKGSGRRELADWMTDPSNPMTARVMVNRIWQHHFGKGIVGTPNDFGIRGDAPVNPELLDWLASRFRESNYSVKAMHRLIMKTRAYRMSSETDSVTATANMKVDAKNDYLWRFDRRRLDAEEVRDAILAAAGDLDPAMGGPHPFPPEITFRYTQHKQFFATYDTKQRSVYLMQQRLRKDQFLGTFDGSDPNASTPVRVAQETSLQALAMLNSAFVDEQADLLAVRAGMAFSTEPERITYAYRLLFGRVPTPAELLDCQNYLYRAGVAFKDSGLPAEKQPRSALASLMHALLASDEFVFVD
jgi:Protein of unknown function (DUF1553)/Protein of unknown function (DUF1549)/Planctomycete cytochrome C